jgi:hypothetical protein
MAFDFLPRADELPAPNLTKPVRGSKLLEHRKKTADEKRAEQKVMADTKLRDSKVCRVPFCEFVAQKLPIDCCHSQHRGAGGNPSGSRTERKLMFAGCRAHHGQYDAGLIDAEPLTADLFDGPVAWLRKHQETGRMETFAIETRIGHSVAVGA